MQFSEFNTEEQTIQPSPIIYKVRVGASSVLKAKHIIERNQNRRLLACEMDGQHAVLTIAATRSDDGDP